MPKRRRKKKSAPSGEAADQNNAQPPSTTEAPTDGGTTPSAPNKKGGRRRRKKKPAADPTPEVREKPKTKSHTSRTGDRKRKKPASRRDFRKKPPAQAEAAETAPPPVRGRRMGLGAGGKPRKGRTAASLQPPASTSSSQPRKPARPASSSRAETGRPASSDGQSQQRSRSARRRQDDTRKATSASDRREKKPAEQKEPVSKTRSQSAKAKQEDVAKKPSRAERSRDQAEPAEKRETVAKSEKKRRKRKRKSAESRPAEPPPEIAPVESAPAEMEKTAEAHEGAPKGKKIRRKSHEADRKPERENKSFPPFGDLVLSNEMLEALAGARYQEPTPVQAGLIPKALEGRDLMGQARTGTGKTAAFGIPLLERFGVGERRSEPGALILVPTRELAVQVRDELAKLAGRRKVTTVAVYGGKPIRGQIEHLRRGAEIVVGTPGRVIDLIDRRALNLTSLECVVLDEADRMLDIGFRPDIEKILRRCPQSRQTLLLSATIPPPVKRLAERYMHEPEMLDFSPTDVAVETIEQFYFTVDPRQKFDLLMRLIEREDPKQAIVFCRTKKGTDRVGTRLARKLNGAAVIHGDLQQRQRDRVMADFRAGKVRFLVATDVVGRGIDVSGISHIINFDIPEFCDDYVHRVGRTGRMGREGVAYTFVSPEEGNELTRIEMRINRLLVRDEMPGFLAVPRPEPTPEAETPTAEPPKAKPVFGKRTRRIRRAL